MGWALNSNSQCDECDSDSGFARSGDECACDPARFLKFSEKDKACTACVSADMVYDAASKTCACPAGSALDAAGNCTTCASGYVSAAGACMSGCYELGARFYYKAETGTSDGGSDEGASGSANSGGAGRVCLECAGVIQTDSDGFRTCLEVVACSGALVEVSGALACVSALPEVKKRMEYDSVSGALVEALVSDVDKKVA